MTDFSTPATPTHIHTHSDYFLGGLSAHRTVVVMSTPASGAWAVANAALYMPFSLPSYYNVKRLWWGNGSAVGGNSSIGIYDSQFGAIYASGSTACSGASQLQYVTPSADIMLPPGAYYLGYSHSATTSNHLITTGLTAANLRMVGAYQEASALPLPAIATPVAVSTNTNVPWAGITRTASGF